MLAFDASVDGAGGAAVPRLATLLHDDAETLPFDAITRAARCGGSAASGATLLQAQTLPFDATAGGAGRAAALLRDSADTLPWLRAVLLFAAGRAGAYVVFDFGWSSVPTIPNQL